jgi:hypothetical protein
MAQQTATDDTAIWSAYNAAELKARDARNDCGPAPIDHVAQAALENTTLTGDDFDAAYAEVFTTINTLVSKYDTDTAADKIQRLRYEL